MDECLFMNFDRFVTAISCYCCYNICFVWSAAISASVDVTFRNTQAKGVHGSKIWFIQLLHSYDYRLSQERGEKNPKKIWKDTDDLGLPLQKTDHLSLHFTSYCQGPWNQSTHRPRALTGTGHRGWPALPLACTSEPKGAAVEQDMGSQASWDAGPACWLFMSTSVGFDTPGIYMTPKHKKS